MAVTPDEPLRRIAEIGASLAPKPTLGKWTTATGPHAYCVDCDWQQVGIPRDTGHRVIFAARLHVQDSGHAVQLQRSQSAMLR